MKRFLLLLNLVTISILLNAQDLREGYIFSKDDTIKGILKFQGDIRNSKECIHISDMDKEKILLPFEIDGYMFKNGKYYISKYLVKSDSTINIFAEYLVKGQKDLFYYRDYAGFHYLINANDSSLIEIPYEQKIVNIDGKSYLRESKQHIILLKSYFSDCPSLFSEIENLKKPDTRSLISITKTYHDLVCGENSCVVYKKQRVPMKIAVEPRLELTKFKGESGYFRQYGGLFFIWLPVSNENLYLKSGVLYSTHNDNISMYKIPLQFEYMFPKKIVKPKFDLGVNVYSLKYPGFTENMGLTLAASGGLQVALTEFMNIDLSLETDILSFTYETDFLISHSFGIGIFFLF
ncbi:MAG: hypothetical protein U0T82_01265 [Bacteroidales bacterium]